MYRTLSAALLISVGGPAVAQQPATTSVPALSQEQIVAFNQAVSDFNAGQQAQQQGDHGAAAAKYQAALPAVRAVVKAEPQNIDYANFLANLLYAKAASDAALQKTDQAVALMEESIPHWRKVAEAKSDDAQSRKILAGLLIQVANAKLAKADKAEAAALYTEALSLSRQLVSNTDGANKNLLLSALVGASQASADPALKAEAIKMSKAMMADGSVDAANRPAAEILSRY